MTIAALLVLAALLDAAFGEPRWLWERVPHPAVLMGRLISRMETALYANSHFAGALLLLVCMVVAGAIGWILSLIGPLVIVPAAAILLAHRSLVTHVARVADDLRLSLQEARKSVAMIVSRDTDALTEPQIARAAIESAAENMSDGVVAPAFWFLIGGLPGLCIYKMVNTADSMIGYRTPRYIRFGWAAARLDDVLNWGPARLTGLAFWIVGSAQGAWSEIAAEARRHKSPNAGWPEAALARALDIALAGPRPYHGEMQDLPWVNKFGQHEIGAERIDAAIVQLWRVWGLFLTLCLGLMWLL